MSFLQSVSSVAEISQYSMHLTLDFHGVIDASPVLFGRLATVIRRSGGIVTIITGESKSPELYARLRDFGYSFSQCEVVSIQDQLLKKRKPIGYNEQGRPIWNDKVWNRFKGDWCAKHKSTLHIDDTLEYREYFTTPFFLYKKELA